MGNSGWDNSVSDGLEIEDSVTVDYGDGLR